MPRGEGISVRKAGNLAIAAVMVVVLLVGVNFVGSFGWIHNPFRSPVRSYEKRVDTPPLRLDLRNVGQYDAASGTYQVVVDVEQRISHIPAFVWSDHVTFLAQGSVDAVVDFSRVRGRRVQRSSDGKTVTITLPAPHLTTPRLDLKHTRILSHDRGVLNRVKDALSTPRSDQPLYLEAQGKVTDSARQDNLLVERGRTNTNKMLNGLLHAAGVKNVIINYDEPPA
jgi:hypothetical protein